MTEQETADDQSCRGKIGELSEAELNDYLELGVVCRLAVLDSRGWPYVQPVWFAWEPDEKCFWIIARKKSVWAGHMKNDNRVALTIDDNSAPYRKVFVQGTAEVVEEPNVGGRWVEIATEMSYRYLGEHGPDYLVPTLNEPRWLFFVRPEKIRTWQGVDWAKRYKHSDWGT